MHWFRSRLKLGSWLALTALAIQLALSFAHVHLDGNAPFGAGAKALAAVQITTDSDAAGGAGAPALADEFCAICALIHLAGTAQTAAAPALDAPVAYRRISIELVAELGSSPPVHAPFSARAPPIA
jgi:hypothetical protein